MRIKLSDHFDSKRLLRDAVSAICMMVFTSIYAIVDGFFVSNYCGKTPFAALNIIYPVIMVISTVGLFTQNRFFVLQKFLTLSRPTPK